MNVNDEGLLSLQLFAVAVIFITIMGILIFGSMSLKRDECRDVGGTPNAKVWNIGMLELANCYKTINGELVEGKPDKLNGEWVFART